MHDDHSASRRLDVLEQEAPHLIDTGTPTHRIDAPVSFSRPLLLLRRPESRWRRRLAALVGLHWYDS